MNVPLLDLKAQYRTIKDRVMEVTQQVFESQYFILGPQVEALEKKNRRLLPDRPCGGGLIGNGCVVVITDGGGDRTG